jgi:hypothetical protein
MVLAIVLVVWIVGIAFALSLAAAAKRGDS